MSIVGNLGTPYIFPLTAALSQGSLMPWLDWHEWWYRDFLIM